jgi:hypothetical protein
MGSTAGFAGIVVSVLHCAVLPASPFDSVGKTFPYCSVYVLCMFCILKNKCHVT